MGMALVKQLAPQGSASECSDNYLHPDSVLSCYWCQFLSARPTCLSHLEVAWLGFVEEKHLGICSIRGELFSLQRRPCSCICGTAESNVTASRCLLCGDVGLCISGNVVLLFIGVELGSLYFCTNKYSVSR